LFLQKGNMAMNNQRQSCMAARGVVWHHHAHTVTHH